MPHVSIQAAIDHAAAQLTATSDSARLDAEVLLAHGLSKNRAFLRAWSDKLLTDDEFAQFQAFIQQRAQGVPVAYLTGHKEFWSRDFKVTPAVLIPRPDTELLVELALQRILEQQLCKVMDLGTGSGMIAITLAAERPKAQVLATDCSREALAVACENAQRLSINNVRFLQSDWFTAVADRNVDIIVSNPPYIAASDPHLQQGDVRFEPESALIAAEAGLSDIRRIVEQARRHLSDGGFLLIEHGYDQKAAVQQLFRQFEYQYIQTCHDLADNPRVTFGQWKIR